MVRRFRKRMTYANVMSTIAVFAAMTTGGAYAASQLAPNSVGSAQLKRHAVTLTKLSPATIAALRGARGPAGPAGAAGPKGDTGAIGAAGPKGDTGAAGAKGDTGPKGDTGAKGDTGTAGRDAPKSVVGTIDGSTGNIVSGSGFTSTRNGAGNYTITIPAGTFQSYAAVSFTPVGRYPHFVFDGGYGQNGTYVFNVASEDGQDTSFSFVASDTQ